MSNTKTLDQGFISFGAKLETKAAPYNPFDGTGDPSDSASYILRPGLDFLRPWLAIQNGPAFQWPLGLEGYNLTIDPALGIHKFIGDNAVKIDVLHTGEEHFTMNGTFPGLTAADQIRALRDLVYQTTKDDVGKILFIPQIFTYAQRVHINHAEFDRDGSVYGNDATYSIEFIRIGTTNEKTGDIAPQPVQGTAKGSSTNSVMTTATYNTLRKVAQWKLKSADNWRTIYNLNTKYFNSNNITISKAPDARLPTGTKLFF